MTIHYKKIGTTRYGGKIYFLEADNPYEIPAIRIFVSSRIKPEDGKNKESLKGISTLGFIDYTNEGNYDVKKYVKKITSFFHGDIGEMGYTGLFISGISRALSFLCWIPIGSLRGIQGVGTERSLRYLSAKSFISHETPKLKNLEKEAFELYENLKDVGVPKEDSRTVLPLSTSTELILQIPVGRELEKWANYLLYNVSYLPEAAEIGKLVKNWNKEYSGFEVPEDEVVYSKFSLRKEESMLNNYLSSVKGEIPDFYFDRKTMTVLANWKNGVPIFSAHQDVRNRQVYHLWSSWEEVVKSTKFYIPNTIRKTKFEERVKNLYKRAYKLGLEFLEDNKPELAIYSQPLSKKFEYISLISQLENIEYTVKLRTCLRAQEEIRSRYWKLATFLRKNGFPKKLGPRCMTKGKCFEPNKETCPMYKHFIKKK